MGTRSVPLDDLALRVAADGPDANDLDLARFVASARAAGVAPVALDVLADSAAPTVVRQRAFGHVAAALAAERRRFRTLALAC